MEYEALGNLRYVSDKTGTRLARVTNRVWGSLGDLLEETHEGRTFSLGYDASGLTSSVGYASSYQVLVDREPVRCKNTADSISLRDGQL